MRKMFLMLGFTIVSTISLLGQENLSFSTVIQTDSVGKATLFSTINDWFATTYNSANDVIQMADKDAGIIVGNGSMRYSYGKMTYSCYEGYVKYTIKVYVKDNRYKILLTNFNHSVKPGNGATCALGTITTEKEFKSSGASKKYYNNVWNDIKSKTEQYSQKIFNSLETKTKKTETESIGDDW